MPGTGAADTRTGLAYGNALPALDKLGLKGSFYLTLSNPGLLAYKRQLVWTDTFINIKQHVRQQQTRPPAAP